MRLLRIAWTVCFLVSPAVCQKETREVSSMANLSCLERIHEKPILFDAGFTGSYDRYLFPDERRVSLRAS